MVKNLPANAGDIRDVGLIPGSKDPLEEGMATHSSIITWRIPRTEEPGGLLCIGSQRVGHDQSGLAHTCIPLHITVGKHNTCSHSATAPPTSWTTGEAGILFTKPRNHWDGY